MIYPGRGKKKCLKPPPSYQSLTSPGMILQVVILESLETLEEMIRHDDDVA